MKGIHSRPPRGEGGAAKYRIDAISRAVRLLEEFSRVNPRRSIDEIARAAGLSANLAQRTLLTLEQHGLVRQATDNSPNYELGLAWLHLADVRRRQVGIRHLAVPVMRRVRDAVNETVILSIRSRFRRVNIDYVESTQAIRRSTLSGFEAPLHIGAAGRSLMSGLAAKELDDYFSSIPLVRFNSETPTPKSAIIGQLDELRERGFAVSVGEITSDTATVSAPIHDHRGDVVATLTISAPADRFTPTLERACIVQATKGAEDLSAALGREYKKAE